MCITKAALLHSYAESLHPFPPLLQKQGGLLFSKQGGLGAEMQKARVFGGLKSGKTRGSTLILQTV